MAATLTVLTYDDFTLGRRALAAGLVTEDRLWELYRRADSAGAEVSLAALFVAEGLASPESVEGLRAPEAALPRTPAPAPALASFAPIADRAPSLDLAPSAPVNPRVLDTLTCVAAPGSAPVRSAHPTPVTLVTPGPGSAAGPAGPAEPSPAVADSVLRTFGKYTLLAELGRGGMGIVYRAREEKVGRLVALKTLLTGLGPNADRLARFEREVRTAASLRHASIVAIHDIGVEDGVHYFTMDLIEGSTLESRLAAGPVPVREGLEWIQAVAEALDYAHRQGVVHRDVKPSNILLDRAGRPFLTDFGLAKQVEAATRITASGTVLGTPAYMSPEQAGGEGGVDARSDIFSLGAVLYECLTRKQAFEGSTPAALLYQTLNCEPVPIRRQNPRVHRDVETICERALQKEPARRYPSAGALAEDLGRFLAGEPILARPPSFAFRGVRWLRKNRVPVGVAVVGAVLAGGVLGYSRVTQGRLERQMAADREREERRERAARDREEGRRKSQLALETARLSRGESRLSHLNSAVAADPDSLEALVLRARTRWGLGRTAEALEDADRALELRPDGASARLLRFRLLEYGCGDPVLARRDLEAAAAQAGDAAPVKAAQGYLALRLGDVARAQACFQEARRQDPRTPDGLAGLAWCSLSQWTLEEGIELTTRAVALDPDNPELGQVRAALFLAACRYEDAAEAANAALERWPALLEAGLIRAEARGLLAAWDDALEAYDRAEAAAHLLARELATLRRPVLPGWDAGAVAVRIDEGRARALIRAGRTEAARPIIRRLADRGHPPWLLSARLARLDGKPDQELACLEKAAASRDGAALAEQADRLLHAGDMGGANATFDRALAASAFPHVPGRYLALADPWVRQVQRYHPERRPEENRFRAAERFLLRALDCDPRFAPARARLAVLRAMAANPKEALQDLDAAIEANPRCTEAWLARACFLRDHREVRDVERAGADLEAALRLVPDSPVALLERGVLDLRRGRIDEALAAAGKALAARPEWARARKLRADALARQGDAPAAQQATEAWKSCPADEEAGACAFGQAEAYGAARKHDSARDFYNRAIEDDPRNAQYWSSRGDCFLRLSNFAECFRDKAQAIRLDPGRDLDLLSSCLDTKAAQPAVAVIAGNAMLQTTQLHPTDPCALFAAGLRHVIFGQNEAAFGQLARVTELDAGFASAYTFKALAALRLGKAAEAEKALARAEELTRDNQLVLLIRACLCTQGGDLEGAARHAQAARRLGHIGEQVLKDLRELAPLRADPRYRGVLGER